MASSANMAGGLEPTASASTEEMEVGYQQVSKRKRNKRSGVDCDSESARKRATPELRNKFGALADLSEGVPKTVKVKSEKPKPIVVHMDLTNFQKVEETIKSTAKGSVRFTFGPKTISVHCTTDADYQNCKSKLEEIQLPFHFYGNKSDHEPKYVIHGTMRHHTDDMVAENLKSMGLKPTGVQVLSKEGETSVRVSRLVKFLNGTQARTVLNLKWLCGVPVSVDKYVNRRGALQCYRCQAFGHGRRNCRGVIRCVKCGENHTASECKLQRNEPAKCCNCNAAHPASSTDCPKRRSYEAGLASRGAGRNAAPPTFSSGKKRDAFPQQASSGAWRKAAPPPPRPKISQPCLAEKR